MRQIESSFDEGTLVQTLVTAHNVFFYCPSFNLTYMGVTKPCGQQVFRLLDNQPWKAGLLDLTFTNRSHTSNESFSADLTETVNERLDPFLHHSDMLVWAKKKIEENLKMNTTATKVDWTEEASSR